MKTKITEFNQAPGLTLLTTQEIIRSCPGIAFNLIHLRSLQQTEFHKPGMQYRINYFQLLRG